MITGFAIGTIVVAGGCVSQSDDALSSRAWSSHALDHTRYSSYGQRVGFNLANNQQWVRYIGEAYEDVFLDDFLCDANPILPTADGGLLVLTVAAQDDGVNRVFVFKYDTNGVAQWDHAFADSGCAGRALTMDYDAQGNVRVATLVDGAVCMGRLSPEGTFIEPLIPHWEGAEIVRNEYPRLYFDSNGEAAYFVNATVRKLDGAGGSPWVVDAQQALPTSIPGAFYEAGVTSMGEVVAVAQLSEPSPFWTPGNGGLIAVAKLDANGATLWSFTRPRYGTAGGGVVESVGIANDDSVFIAGLEEVDAHSAARSFYLGLDAQGEPSFDARGHDSFVGPGEVEAQQPARARQLANGDWIVASMHRNGTYTTNAELRVVDPEGASLSNRLVQRTWNGGGSGGGDKLEDARVAPDGSVYVTGCAGTEEYIACIGSSYGSRGRFIAKYEAP